MRRAASLVECAARPTTKLILAVVVVGVLADQAYRRIGSDGLGAGVLDEAAHLATGFLVLAALFRGASTAFSAGLLVWSVLIDADHIPQYLLGTRFLTVGTDRPYTHCLLTLGLFVLLAVALKTHRRLWAGSAMGLAFHFYRDTAENSHSGVALLWPFSDHSYTSPHWIYLDVMAALAVIALAVTGTHVQIEGSPAP
ncbi:MAG: metal-dependent hydrolase [Solirubrobacteraceae bacterium]